MNTKQALILTGTGISLVGGFLLGRKIYKKWKLNREVKRYDKETFDPNTGKRIKGGAGSTPGVQKINLVEVADSIARNLGVIYASYDPRSWSENDDIVFALINKVPNVLIAKLVEVYKDKYKRNLKQDLNSFLDQELYDKVQGKFY